MANPLRTASRTVARTQWSVAMPQTSTASIPRSRSHAARPMPPSVMPSNPLNAAACCPFRKISSTWGTAGANAGWKAAPALPARQCTGQVSPKSGSWPSGAQW